MIIERHDIYGYYKLGELTDLLESLGYIGECDITLGNGNMAPYLTAEPKE